MKIYINYSAEYKRFNISCHALEGYYEKEVSPAFYRRCIKAIDAFNLVQMDLLELEVKGKEINPQIAVASI